MYFFTKSLPFSRDEELIACMVCVAWASFRERMRSSKNQLDIMPVAVRVLESSMPGVGLRGTNLRCPSGVEELYWHGGGCCGWELVGWGLDGRH